MAAREEEGKGLCRGLEGKAEGKVREGEGMALIFMLYLGIEVEVREEDDDAGGGAICVGPVPAFREPVASCQSLINDPSLPTPALKFDLIPLAAKDD